jgi:hypothetical protein
MDNAVHRLVDRAIAARNRHRIEAGGIGRLGQAFGMERRVGLGHRDGGAQPHQPGAKALEFAAGTPSGRRVIDRQDAAHRLAPLRL